MAYLLNPVGMWVEDGLCGQIDPEVWFPSTLNIKEQNRAKNICKECPVINECLEYALAADEPHGVWGGTTPQERRALYREEPA
jgi:WhiB family redox-sensing transcriptional regulator